MYSRRVRRTTLGVTGNKVIEDYGVISEGRFFGFWQSLRLLKVQNGNLEFFILEERTRRFASLVPEIHWLKLQEPDIQKLLALASSVEI